MTAVQNERELSFTPYQPAADEEYMNDAQVAHFQKILLDWKEQLIHEAESTKSYKSLAEIESGDYGFCQTCGVEIGLRRLEARPTATQCIDCKTLSEIKEKQAWGHA